MANLMDLIGRVFISTIFLFSGYNKIFNYSGTVVWMEGFGVPGFLLGPTIVLEILLPILIIIGYRTQISAILLAIFCIATAIIFHLDFDNQGQTIAFLKNFALAGGFLFIAAHGPKEWSVEKKKKYVRL
ncbi:DoxX family protein [Pelagibacterales bacterium SAG-MED29]|nr:DoxX family protein [Pelagibacterales bacterium SAG-MED29]